MLHREGNRAQLLCGLARGDPPIRFAWLKDRLPVTSQTGSDVISVLEVDEYSSLLIIKSLRASHSGNYTCAAQNAAGRDERTATLTVKGF